MIIPSNPKYDIDENAIVRLISTGDVIPEYRNHHGLRAVKIRGKSHKPASQPIARLMLISYKPLDQNKDPDWLSVKYLNGDEDDVRLDNLEWDETWYTPTLIPGVNIARDTWIAVHGYPEVEIRITMDSILLRESATWREIGCRIDSGGYLFFTTPGTRRNLRVNRAVALTFLPHPIDASRLVVNHKDSDKTNNNPRNLEWATYSENNFHAYNEGPRSETVRKIRLKHMHTGEEIVVAGYQEMARYLGATPQGVHQAFTRRVGKGVPYREYYFKYEDDPRSWDEILTEATVSYAEKYPKVAVKDMYTGVVTTYTKFRDLLNEEKIRDFMVDRLLKQKVIVPRRGKCFQQVKDDKPLLWPIYPYELMEAYDRIGAVGKPIIVKDTFSGEIKYYGSITEWCMEDCENRKDPAVMSRYLKRASENPEHKLKWNGWEIEYVDLRKFPLAP